jgi:hypothetical protein
MSLADGRLTAPGSDPRDVVRSCHFDYSTPFAPVDRGLYTRSFTVTFLPKPKKGK